MTGLSTRRQSACQEMRNTTTPDTTRASPAPAGRSSEAVTAVPRLVRAGVDPRQIETEGRCLPPAIWQRMEVIVLAIGGSEQRFEAAVWLYQICERRLQEGISAEERVEALQNSDCWVQLLRHPQTLAAVARLRQPEQVVGKIVPALMAHSFWKSAREVQGLEWCRQIEEGEQAGETLAGILDRLGWISAAVKTAEKRPAKRRLTANQRLIRRIRAGVFVLLLVGVGYLGWRHVSYWSLQPARSHDLFEVFDSEVRQTPELERSWPELRAALVTLKGAVPGQSLEDIIESRPGSPGWNDTVRFFEINQPALDRILAATRRATLGFLYDDLRGDLTRPAPAEPLRGIQYGPLNTKFNTPGIYRLLVAVAPYNEELRKVSNLLDARSRLALERGDLSVAVAVAVSQLGVARQAVEAPDFWSTRSDTLAVTGTALDAVRELLHAQGNRLSDRDLEKLRTVLETFPVAELIATNKVWDRMAAVTADWYSDDGRGSGKPLGESVLNSYGWMNTPRWIPTPEWLVWPVDQWDVERWEMTLRAPYLAERLVDRKQTEQLIQQLAAEDQTVRQASNWGSQIYFELPAWAAITSQPQWQQHYGVVQCLMIQTTLDKRSHNKRIVNLVLGHAAARLRVALEQYRRAQNRWPAALAELVPDYLPAVPLDPYDGNPVRFTNSPAGLLLYSIGLDLVDDTAAQTGPPLAVSKDDVALLELK